MKTATIIGATGATGRHLVRQLINHSNYTKVIVLTRRTLNLKRPNYQEHLVDFANPEQWASLVQGNELFSALGTTAKQAGSKSAQYAVDVTYQLNAARAASENGVSKLVLLSSPNANSRSKNFYLRIKGELEEAVLALSFSQTIIFKPSIIESNRPDGRPAEKIAGTILNAGWRWVPGWGKYRPIRAEMLASAMINVANFDQSDKHIVVELDNIFTFVSPTITSG